MLAGTRAARVTEARERERERERERARIGECDMRTRAISAYLPCDYHRA